MFEVYLRQTVTGLKRNNVRPVSFGTRAALVVVLAAATVVTVLVVVLDALGAVVVVLYQRGVAELQLVQLLPQLVALLLLFLLPGKHAFVTGMKRFVCFLNKKLDLFHIGKSV